MVDNYSVSPNGNVRRTGPGVGHNTSVRSAVPSQTDISQIKIQGSVDRKNAKTENKIHWSDAMVNSSLDEDRAYLDVVRQEELNASDSFDYGVKNDDIAKDELAKATLKRQQVEAIIEEKTARDELKKSVAEAKPLAMKNKKFLRLDQKKRMIDADNRWVLAEDMSYDQIVAERNKILSENPELDNVIRTMDNAINKHLEAIQRCKALGL